MIIWALCCIGDNFLSEMHEILRGLLLGDWVVNFLVMSKVICC